MATPTPACLANPVPISLFPLAKNYFAAAGQDGPPTSYGACCGDFKLKVVDECWSYCELPTTFCYGPQHMDYASQAQADFLNCAVQHGLHLGKTTKMFGVGSKTGLGVNGDVRDRAMKALLGIVAVTCIMNLV